MEHAKDSDPDVAEEIARTRSRFAYSLARGGEYKAAAEAFQALTEAYEGGAKRDDNSEVTLVEDAQYQAAVCLQVDGREQEAVAAFTGFVRSNPTSPLVTAVTKRIDDMTDRKPPAEFQNAMEQAEATRERLTKEIRMQQAMCGPEALARAAQIFSIEADPKTIAKMAGTTERGTSLSGLQRAAHALGMSAVGLRVTLKGLDEVRLPSLLLYPGHYVVVEARDRERLRIYDPADGATTWVLSRWFRTAIPGVWCS